MPQNRLVLCFVWLIHNFFFHFRREREKLLHKFEVDPSNIRQADVSKCVKEYRRPTVGKQDNEPNDFRPPDVLLKTVFYLIDNISTKRSEWSEIYEFIFDRLRSVRQDLVVQDVQSLYTVKILERTVRFHIYSEYRLCTAHLAVFDPKINRQHTQECLKRLINLYTELGSDVWSQRIEMETLYLLFNLGDLDSIYHFYTLPDQLRHNTDIKLAYCTSLAYMVNNWSQVIRNIHKLQSPIYLCAIHRHLPQIQRNALRVMNAGYSSKNCKFPLEKIKTSLFLNTDSEAQSLCQQFGINVEGTFAQFQKANFKMDEKISRTPSDFINDVLKQWSLPQILHGDINTELDLTEQFSHMCQT
ncbi:cell division [Mactra antiquata]